MTPTELAARHPVWMALSEFYLDTELSPRDFERQAEALAASPYSICELTHILLTEVHPVCVTNLLSVAGVWNSFDPDWLRRRILRRRHAWLRWPTRLLPQRRVTLARVGPLFARVSQLRQPRAIG